MRSPSLILAPVLLLALAAGCESVRPARAALPATTGPATQGAGGADADTTPLPEGWNTCGVVGFEARLADWQAKAPRRLAAADREALRAALAARDAIAVRAALLLAHAEGGHVDLIEHLEERLPSASRALDASDVVAAAALTGEQRDRVPERLVALAVPGEQHPDIEVRVECARAALISGRDEVIRFLLQILRTGTRDEALDPPDWSGVDKLAWIKSRSAEALSWRAGVAVEFRPDGSYDHQEAEARRLESLLRDGR